MPRRGDATRLPAWGSGRPSRDASAAPGLPPEMNGRRPQQLPSDHYPAAPGGQVTAAIGRRSDRTSRVDLVSQGCWFESNRRSSTCGIAAPCGRLKRSTPTSLPPFHRVASAGGRERRRAWSLAQRVAWLWRSAVRQRVHEGRAELDHRPCAPRAGVSAVRSSRPRSRARLLMRFGPGGDGRPAIRRSE